MESFAQNSNTACLEVELQQSSQISAHRVYFATLGTDGSLTDG